MPVKNNFVIIYWESLKAFGLKLNEAALLGMVMSLSARDGYCYASKKYIANHLGIGVSTLFEMITKLSEMGLLESERIGARLAHLRVTSTWKEYIYQMRGENEPISDSDEDFFKSLDLS